jgi:CRISPR-associated protein Csd1
MIRRYERGNYQQLRDSLNLWYSDLALCNGIGTDNIKQCKLAARLLRLLKYQKNDRKLFERMNKELSGLLPSILIAILTGNPFPDCVASKSLAYIKLKMMGADKDDASVPVPDALACQWLKVWLIRKNRMRGREENLMEKYTMTHPSAAYHCGGIMAVYAMIQKRAMPDVNAGVIQRYYASACQSPALVLGKLSKLSNYHIEKIEDKKAVIYYRRKLEELYVALKTEIPKTLTLEEQSYFALGYYQMSAVLNGGKKQVEKEIEN